MVKHTLVRDDPFQAINVKIGILLEHFCTIWTTAKVNFLPTDVHRHGRCDRFFSQASWAYNQVLRLLKVLRWISSEQVGASLATEVIFLSIGAARYRLLFADPQPHQGTATCRANERLHVLSPFSCEERQHTLVATQTSWVAGWRWTYRALRWEASPFAIHRMVC